MTLTITEYSMPEKPACACQSPCKKEQLGLKPPMKYLRLYNPLEVAKKPCKTGLYLAALSAFLMSVNSALVKTAEVPSGEITFLGFFGVLLVTLPLALVRGEELFPKGSRKVLLAHSFGGSQAVITSYQAVRLMPLADESVLAYGSVFFTVVFARIFLKEPCTHFKIISSVLIVVGVVLLCEPFQHSTKVNYAYYSLGLTMSIIGAINDAASYIFMKKLVNLHYSVVLVNYSLVGVACTACFAFFETWTVPDNIYPVALVVIFTVIQEVYLAKSMYMEEAGLVALLQCGDIVFAFMWEIIFFDESYSVMRVLGAFLIISTLAVLTYKEGNETNQSEEPTKSIV